MAIVARRECAIKIEDDRKIDRLRRIRETEFYGARPLRQSTGYRNRPIIQYILLPGIAIAISMSLATSSTDYTKQS